MPVPNFKCNSKTLLETKSKNQTWHQRLLCHFCTLKLSRWDFLQSPSFCSSGNCQNSIGKNRDVLCSVIRIIYLLWRFRFVHFISMAWEKRANHLKTVWWCKKPTAKNYIRRWGDKVSQLFLYDLYSYSQTIIFINGEQLLRAGKDEKHH